MASCMAACMYHSSQHCSAWKGLGICVVVCVTRRLLKYTWGFWGVIKEIVFWGVACRTLVAAGHVNHMTRLVM